MEMIAMLGGLGRNTAAGPLVVPQRIYTGMEGIRAPMLAALGAEPEKDEAWYETTLGKVGIGVAVLGVLWHLSRRRDEPDYEGMYGEMQAQESMERGLPIRTDGLGQVSPYVERPRKRSIAPLPKGREFEINGLGGRGRSSGRSSRRAKTGALGAMKKVKAPSIKKGDIVAFPGDAKKRNDWGEVTKVKKSGNVVTYEAVFFDPPHAGVYMARATESLNVNPDKAQPDITRSVLAQQRKEEAESRERERKRKEDLERLEREWGKF